MYQQVYFYIDSGYWTERWTKETAELFHKESDQLFEDAGWRILEKAHNGTCTSVGKGKQELYLHPTSFSGVILAEEIPGIEQLISKAKTFRHRYTKGYEEYQDMDDESYLAYLDSRKEEISEVILRTYKTKRRNLYIVEDLTRRIGEPFLIRRVSSKDKNGDKAFLMVGRLIEEMIADGRLVTAETRHGLGIRTAVKADTILKAEVRQ